VRLWGVRKPKRRCSACKFACHQFRQLSAKMLCRITCLVAFVVAGISANYVPGGPSQIDDVNDESVVAAADFAVTEMNKQSNFEYKLIRSSIVGGTMQVRPLFL